MSALNEIKDRIGSVRSTLKITSAMKLVASSKLHKAEMAIEAVRPYERTLEQILSVVDSYRSDEDAAPKSADAPVAVVAIASNSSLCGAFNSNVIHKVLEVCAEYPSVKIFPIGRRMAEAMTKAGHAAETDYSDIIGKPDYYKSRTLVRELRRRFAAGEFSKVVLVYNKYVSSSSQVPVVEPYLPYEKLSDRSDGQQLVNDDYIFEPDPETLAATMIPYLLAMKFHAAVLDSAAAEHAARTIAMQTASENAERLLSDLTLEYNKGRQEKITSEILDLESGGEGQQA